MAKSRSPKKPSVVASPASPKRKAPKPMDMDIVTAYVSKLVAALGDQERFSIIYGQMEFDKRVRQQEAACIAKSFYGDANSSTTKSEAFRRIRLRQNAIMDSRAKSRAQAGRSAA
jgi:hypothetical protein